VFVGIVAFVIGVVMIRLGFDQLTGKLPLAHENMPKEPIVAVILGISFCFGAPYWVWRQLTSN
jgi:multisubunit Na+/H+ antiporter MnhB subunit